MVKLKKEYCLLLLLLVFARTGSAQTPAFITDSLDTYIKKGMTDWQIPGLALAVVKDGKVVLTKGYGLQEIGKSRPVDENTLFMIASNTKLFTATALAMLEEQKKLSLDDKVIKYLPDFRLYDSNTTQLVTIRDALSHRMGTSDYQGDFAFWDTDLTRQEVVHRMRLLVPPNQFRQDFGYSNAGYVVASEIIPKVAGMSWETYVETTVLKPLNMNNTFMFTAGMDKRPNVALPYSTCCSADNKLRRMPIDNLNNLGPATGMVSSAKDMATWLLMQLDSGRFEGKQILPWSVLKQTRVANTIVSTNKLTTFPIGFQFYCLGTGRIEYADNTVFTQWGGATGYRSNTTLVPDKKLGIVILTSQDNSNFHEALRYQILDAYLNVPYKDRSQYFLKSGRKKNQKNSDEIKALASRVEKNVKPALSLTAYSGTYQNATYGTLSITPDTTRGKQSLLVRFQHHKNLQAQLDYMDGNEFRFSFTNPRFPSFPVTFTTVNGKIEGLEMKESEFVDNDLYVFKKAAN